MKISPFAASLSKKADNEKTKNHEKSSLKHEETPFAAKNSVTMKSLFIEKTKDALEKKHEKNPELKKIQKMIEKQGENLSKAPSIMDYELYKNNIQKLLKMVVPDAFSNKEFRNKPVFLNGERTQKQYFVVRAIDEELEAILKMIHHKEKSNLAIASKVIKIKGLICDITG